RFVLGLAFGERRRLPFAGSAKLVEQASEVLDLSLQVGDPPQQGLTSWTGSRFHAQSLAKTVRCSCASLRAKSGRQEEEKKRGRGPFCLDITRSRWVQWVPCPANPGLLLAAMCV